MSRAGAPRLGRAAPDLHVAIIAASWHEPVMTGLIEGAERALTEAGISDHVLLRVPGTFELPVAAARMAQAHDALVALGAVIRGETPHFEYICQAATIGLTEVAVRTGTPIGFGILTCENEPQALDRAGIPGSSEDKGYEAAQAAVCLVGALREAGA